MKLKCTVTKDDLKHGNDRPCNCPVARALNRELKKINPRYYAEFVPYAAFVDPEGLEIFEKWGDDEAIAKIPVEECPEEIVEFASEFDDWYRLGKYFDGNFEEFQEQYGRDWPPDEPCPFEFTLNIKLPEGGE